MWEPWDTCMIMIIFRHFNRFKVLFSPIPKDKKKKKEEYNRRDWVYNMRRICFFVKFNCHTSSKRGASVRYVVVVVAFNLKSLYLENSHRINIIKTYENSRITVIYNVLILRKFMRITLFKNWPIRGDPLCWSNFSV